RKPERPAIADTDLLTVRDRAERNEGDHQRFLMPDDLGVRLLGVVAERDDAEDDAGAILPLAEAEVVVAEARLGDAPRIRVIVDDDRTAHNGRALADLLRRDE